MAAVSASQPQRPPSPEIIDVDALPGEEEDTIVFTGFHGRPRAHHRPASYAGPSSVHTSHDDDIAFTGFRRRSPRRALRTATSAQAGPSVGSTGDNAIVLDSDDDEAPVAGPSRNTRVSRRLLSPPPPAAQRGHTPGVPPLPPHLASQASLPRRSRAPAPDVPPPIRPLARPLPFESRVQSSSRLPRLPPRNSPQPAPSAAPRSHHQPSMGLGGALIALNRQNALQEANRANQEQARPYRAFNLPSFTEMLRRMTGFGGGDEDRPTGPGDNGQRPRHRFFPWTWEDVAAQPEREHLSPFANNDVWFGLPDHLDALRPGGVRFGQGTVPDKIPPWKPEYTHPYKLAPGFTYDFEVSDESSSGSSSSSQGVIVLDEDEAGPSNAGSPSATAVETTLVCARCLDPLVLAPGDGVSGDAKMRRVWALRCGHMLDGKCVAELMTPPEAPASPESTGPTEEQPSPSGSGKGKEKARVDPKPLVAPADDSPHAPVAAAEAAPAGDRKGKRKAVEPLEPEEPPKRPALAAPAASEDNSIRSRLRSRARAQPPADESPPSPARAAHVTAAEGGPYSSPRRGRRQQPGTPSSPQGHAQGPGRAKGKGKGRARVERKPVAEAEHGWRCPVAGCGCVHYSVRIGGVWANDEGRGPIALFV